MKVITILEGDVPEDKWIELRRGYEQIAVPERAEIVPEKSALVQDYNNPSRWLILSVWKNMETLEKMRNSLETPSGVLVFKKVGVEPALSVLKVQFRI